MNSMAAKVLDFLRANERILTYVSLAMIVVIGLAFGVFYQLVIMPQLRLREDLINQLSLAQRDLVKQRQADPWAPEKVQRQLDAAKAEYSQAASIFMTESEAAGVLDALYQYAEDAGATVVKLEGEPNLEAEAQKAEGYDVRLFRMEVTGSFADLMDFVTRIDEAKQKSVRISNVNIPEGTEPHTLTLDISLYTSPYAAAKTGPLSLDTQITQQMLTQLSNSLEEAWGAGQWEQAIGAANQLLALNPGDAALLGKLYMARVKWGYDLLSRGDNAGAIAQFNLALMVRPDGAEALDGLQKASPPGGAPAAPTPVGLAAPTPTSLLVRPAGWPTDRPWPPKQ